MPHMAKLISITIRISISLLTIISLFVRVFGELI
jgi:hypothetical protein